jgi:predicted nucleic acid-binding protein
MAVAEKKDPAMKLIGLAGEDTDSPVAVKKLFVDTQHFRDSSYVDAVSFSLMQEMEITEAFAFDQHFGTVGFICVPQ